MKIKIFFALFICLLISSDINAQSRRIFPAATPTPEKVFPVLRENYASASSDEIFTVGKVTGDIGKTEVLYLPKPFYPGDAKKDSAEGKIYVQISIDEKGSVVSARSTDGHPALRRAAEESALSSKFRALTIDNQPVKSDGWLVYNFEIAKSSWLKLGYDLAFLHTPWVNQKLALAGIKKNFKTDWTAENEMVSKLEEFVAQMPPPEKFDDVPMFTTQTINKNGTIYKSQTFSRRLPSRPAPNPEQIAVTQNLIAALQSRLAVDEIASWQFNLAFAILKEANSPRDPNEPRQSSETLKTFLQNAPPNLPAEYKTELANLIKIIETENREKSFDAIRNSIIRLQKLQ
ncbi:MAG: energy transducer TonB [Pyrinomonadaceae bacterium]